MAGVNHGNLTFPAASIFWVESVWKTKIVTFTILGEFLETHCEADQIAMVYKSFQSVVPMGGKLNF